MRKIIDEYEVFELKDFENSILRCAKNYEVIRNVRFEDSPYVLSDDVKKEDGDLIINIYFNGGDDIFYGSFCLFDKGSLPCVNFGFKIRNNLCWLDSNVDLNIRLLVNERNFGG